ncbi:fibrinogen-like protein 1-like protein isoform X1 [Pogoniulus pusillus]|uniref:fibrinogen-like protein 1-like protein isoform X1 n=1 Tax=Pogoniulus pusillus TaxID=488313 RepID=UPI0030B973CE
MSPSTAPLPLLNTSRNGDSTTSLGSLFQCLKALLVKKFLLTSSLNFPWCNLRPFPLGSNLTFNTSRDGVSTTSCDNHSSPEGAAQRLCLLLFTCLLTLAASFPDIYIRNLHLLNGTMDEIMNAPPETTQPDDGDEHVRRVRDVAPHRPAAHAPGWPKDCSEMPAGSRSGVYIIQPKGLHHLVVYCEMNVTSGGWTVIQRNQKDTPVTWAESWSTYKFGFGSVRSEYWLGTEYIHQIAKQKVYQVRFVIQDSTDNINFADYNLFSVEDENHGYRLRLGSYTGTAGDAMTSDNPNTMHDNMKFSTKDRDQDNYSKNCAYSYEGGWWYSSCYAVRLNFKGGMTWGNLCKGNCKSSLILIKPASYC